MHVDALRKPHNALFLEERCDARDESVELILVHPIVRRRGIGDDFLIIGLARCRAFQILVENEVAILAVTAQDVLLLVAEYRSEEHTYDLQSLMRIAYAVFCLETKR